MIWLVIALATSSGPVRFDWSSPGYAFLLKLVAIGQGEYSCTFVFVSLHSFA